jgi:hypothetical protein
MRGPLQRREATSARAGRTKRGARELLLPARTPLPLAQDPHAHAKLPALGQSSPPRKKAGQRGGSVITAHSDKGAEASPASPP